MHGKMTRVESVELMPVGNNLCMYHTYTILVPRISALLRLFCTTSASMDSRSAGGAIAVTVILVRLSHSQQVAAEFELSSILHVFLDSDS
jgi:hypothetical protein